MVGDYSDIKARHHHPNLSDREIHENRRLSSCRECIEWDYGDVGTMWAYLDYKRAIRMRRTNVAAAYSTLILRNAHNTMIGHV